MDVAYHDEDFNREHKEVLDNIQVDPPIKVHMILLGCTLKWQPTSTVMATWKTLEKPRSGQSKRYKDGMMLLAEKLCRHFRTTVAGNYYPS
jgi:hypothetical protein